MKPGQVIHLGDGAYLHFDGYGFEFRANHHENPTDRVYIDGGDMWNLIRILQESITPPSAEEYNRLGCQDERNDGLVSPLTGEDQ